VQVLKVDTRSEPGTFGYGLFSISKPDLVKLQALHLEYVRAMQSLIVRSQPADCVVLYCVHMLDLEPGEHNALAPTKLSTP
jgi:hypothetical protein